MKAIQVLSLSKNYNGKKAIENINFDVDKGEIVGFIGPNGAGKSTTIKAMLNFIYPTSGSCKIFGLDCEKESKRIKELVGYVPSEVRFYNDMKVRDILNYAESFYDNIDKNRVKDLCRRFEIEENKKMGELSLGNKKKVAIVQAFINSPKLIILDEPTNGLDPLVQNVLFEVLLEEKRKGATIFLSSHNLTEVQNYCNRAIIIKDGRIVGIKDMSRIKAFNKKKVTILTNENIERDIRILGGEKVKRIKNSVVFSYSGDINTLIRLLASYEIDDISIGEEELADTFINYYKGRE